MTRVILSTGNAHKLEEFQRMLAPLGYAVAASRELFPDLDVEETGDTFEENALLKAQALYDLTGEMTLADDSGLVVDALGGAPGVYSARYAGEGATDEQNNEKLLAALQGVPPGRRTARFVSAIACVLPGGRAFTVRGECPGVIGLKARGAGGFGYDPLFYVGDETFASMSGTEKDSVSHRGRALRLLAERLKGENR